MKLRVLGWTVTTIMTVATVAWGGSELQEGPVSSSSLVQSVLETAATSYDPQAFQVCSSEFRESLGRLGNKLGDLASTVARMAPHQSAEIIRSIKPFRQDVEALVKQSASCFKADVVVALLLSAVTQQLADLELRMITMKNAAEIGDIEGSHYRDTHNAAEDHIVKARDLVERFLGSYPLRCKEIELRFQRKAENAKRALDFATGFAR